MPDQQPTVGDLVAAFLHATGVGAAFGVISIHNMPILDAIGRAGKIRFVPSRGEAGAVNMADAYARAGNRLGVCFTSTGTGAGNGAGALVEAETAGTPLLHITGQIDTPYLDKGMAYIHEAKAQLKMLEAVSKAAFRISKPEEALDVLRIAAQMALTAPNGPVSVEIPADVQAAAVDIPDDVSPLDVPLIRPDPADLDELAATLREARRPLLWLGGGARHAGDAVARLVDKGVGVVTSVNGRGIVSEDHPLSLGAFNMTPESEAFYETLDAVVVAGSRLRGNETRNYKLPFPKTLVQIDADPASKNRCFRSSQFICADSALVLEGLAERLTDGPKIDNSYARDLAGAKAAAEDRTRDELGPYADICAALQSVTPANAPWVRDITLSNSTWGNRLFRIHGPHDGIHALGGGIGQAVPMGVGAAVAAPDRKSVVLTGDGGLMLCVSELATAVQEKADIAIILMNDGGYGVIKNIQDAKFGGRHYFADMQNPDFAALCAGINLPHRLVKDTGSFAEAAAEAVAVDGPAVVEVDMLSVGPFKKPFGGPPPPKAA